MNKRQLANNWNQTKRRAHCLCVDACVCDFEYMCNLLAFLLEICGINAQSDGKHWIGWAFFFDTHSPPIVLTRYIFIVYLQIITKSNQILFFSRNCILSLNLLNERDPEITWIVKQFVKCSQMSRMNIFHINFDKQSEWERDSDCEGGSAYQGHTRAVIPTFNRN